MNIKPLTIGELTCRLPIIQGGMGVGVSLANLASAVANAGGIGVISAAQIGFKEKDFENNTFEANIRALKRNIIDAKKKSSDGIIGVNMMVAMNNYEEYVKAAIEAGVDLIISGAGLPTALPKIITGSNVKIAPIVSSYKGCKIILKLWDRHDKVAPDMVVVEGPKAGGHLGFHEGDIEESICSFDDTIVEIKNEIKIYEDKYNKKIPLIIAGGVFDGKDIAKYLKLGADGVQMATRFVTTEECDASLEYKNAYIKANKEDVVIVKSPVGMPGRAILNDFVKKTEIKNNMINKCYRCLKPCNPKETPYCISKALINAVEGNINDGLIFCGSNVYKLKEITTVPKLMKELEKEILENI